MKDYYDIWLLSHQFKFDGQTLGKAIEATCGIRSTLIVAEPIALSDAFVNEKNTQWKALIKKSELDSAPQNLKDIVNQLKIFFLPILFHIEKREAIALIWKAPGPWIPKGKPQLSSLSLLERM
jgi:hypothetical protein